MINKFYRIPIILGLILLSGCSDEVQLGKDLNCESLKGCEQKICNLKNDIDSAKKANNKYRVDGLETALGKVQKYCTDDGLIEELEDKINDTKKDLKEDTENHEEAIRDNRADKIKKYKTKMDEEMQELNKLQEELKQLR